VDVFPKPAELWQRFRASEKIEDEDAASKLLTPRQRRHRQGAALLSRNRHQPGRSGGAAGQKTNSPDNGDGYRQDGVAFQICWKLWNMRWNRAGEHRRPKILYLADRNILIDDPKD